MMKDDRQKRITNTLDWLEFILNGGKGSGNFGHKGRPGVVGGSGSGQGVTAKESEQDVATRGLKTTKSLVGIDGTRTLGADEKVPRLARNSAEKAIEDEFCQNWEDPKKREEAIEFAKKLAKEDGSKLGDDIQSFETDAIKQLDPRWGKDDRLKELGKMQPRTPEQEKEYQGMLEYRQKYNTLLHQTANAVAKEAFARTVKANPGDITVTTGGCGSGKGFGLEMAASYNKNSKAHELDTGNIGKVLSGTLKKSKYVWDSAGDQNATELGWLKGLAGSNKLNIIHTDANPQHQASSDKVGLVTRALSKGRMVDATVYTQSYTKGTQNVISFRNTYKNDSSVTFTALNAQPNTKTGFATTKVDTKWVKSLYPNLTTSQALKIIQGYRPNSNVTRAQLDNIWEGATFFTNK